MITLPYILQVQVCIALFWTVYRLCMRGSGAFRHNRAYLLACIPLAFIIPALSIPVWPAPEPQPLAAVFDIGGLEAFFIPAEETPGVGWQEIAGWVYAAGAAVMFAGVLRHLIKMRRSLRRSQVVRMDNVKIVSHETIRSPYSFFRYIFVNPEPDGSEKLPQIVAHEMAHVRLGHSYDSVFAQLMLIFFWWNPFVWFWNRSLKEVHEYQADAAVLEHGFDSKQYIELLIGTLAGIHPKFVSGFSYSLLKNRLIMMTKKQNGRLAGFRILAAAPVTAALMLFFSFTEKSVPVSETAPEWSAVAGEMLPEPVVSSETQPPPADADEPFIEVEKMPTFQGGDVTTFRNWAMSRVRYPAEAASKGIQGRVLVQFIIEKDGTLSSVEVLNSPDRLLSDEAVRAVSASPRWTPGTQRGEAVRVRYFLPIDFRLAAESPAPSAPATAARATSTDEPFMRVEKMPQFEGNNEVVFRRWVMERLRYPVEAASGGIQGRVMVQFIVEKDGSVSSIEALSSPDKSLSDEVVRVVSASPKWTPGTQRGEDVRVRLILPIDFRLEGADNAPATESNVLNDVVVIGYGVQRKPGTTGNEETVSNTSPSGWLRRGQPAGDPLFVVDGQKMARNYNTNSIDVSTIESIEVLKDESAMRVYGEEGKNGVVVITTKAK